MIGSNNYKLTMEELSLAVENRRFSDQVKKIAKAVLVDGLTPSKVATEYGVTRGRVYMIRDQVVAAYLTVSTYPENWQRVTIIASPVLIEEFQMRAEQERQAWLASK